MLLLLTDAAAATAAATVVRRPLFIRFDNGCEVEGQFVKRQTLPLVTHLQRPKLFHAASSKREKEPKRETRGKKERKKGKSITAPLHKFTGLLFTCNVRETLKISAETKNYYKKKH